MSEPTVFISYRREPSSELTGKLHKQLVKWGADVFFDIESMTAGRFATQIEKQIINREYFILIIAPATLASEWVQLEIETALRHHKMIIPIVEKGYPFYEGLPENINEITEFHAFSCIHKDLKLPSRQIYKALKFDEEESSKPDQKLPVLLIATIAVVIILIGGFALFNLFIGTKKAATLTEITELTDTPQTQASEGGFPCEGTIVFTTGAHLNVVRTSSSRTSPLRSPIQQGINVNIIDFRESFGDAWYQIEYGDNSGWLLAEYISNETCF